MSDTPVRLGLRENRAQFAIWVLVNAFVGVVSFSGLKNGVGLSHFSGSYCAGDASTAAGRAYRHIPPLARFGLCLWRSYFRHYGRYFWHTSRHFAHWCAYGRFCAGDSGADAGVRDCVGKRLSTSRSRCCIKAKSSCFLPT